MSDSTTPPKVYPVLPPGRTYLIENVKYKDQFARGDTQNKTGPSGSTDPPVYVAKQNNTPYEKVSINVHVLVLVRVIPLTTLISRHPQWIVRGTEVFEGRALPSDYAYYNIQNAGTREYAWSKRDPQPTDAVLDKTPRVWAIEAVTPQQSPEDIRTVEWV